MEEERDGEGDVRKKRKREGSASKNERNERRLKKVLALTQSGTVNVFKPTKGSALCSHVSINAFPSLFENHSIL